MKKIAILGFLIGVMAVIAFPAQAVLIEQDSRDEENGITANGTWAEGFQIQWTIETGGPLGYIYTYTFTSDGETPLTGTPSHLILEVSKDAPNALFKSGEDFLTPQDWGPAPSNPGLEDTFWGIKLDFSADSYTLYSTQAPMWGDFYTKDGRAGDSDWNYAYNSGIGDAPESPFTNWVRVPDTVTVPEPGMALLLGSGLVGLALLRRRFKE